MGGDTLAAVTALVVLVCALLFIIETFLRREDPTGRLWALGFLGGGATTLLYLAWAADPGAWWAVAAGNGTMVASAGLLWLGCRRYNDQSMRLPGWIVAAASVAASVAVVVEGPDIGGWAGALWMFVPLCGFGIAGAVATRSGAMRRAPNAIPLTVVFALQGAFYFVRIVVFSTSGPDSELFSVWFGTTTASGLTVVLTITAVVAMSVLRTDRAQLRGWAAASDGAMFGVRSRGDVVTALQHIVQASRPQDDLPAVLVIRTAELDYIATAFGIELADELVAAGRAAVLRAVPPLAIVGEDGEGRLAVITTVRSSGEARRVGMAVYRELFDALNSVSGGVLPSLGIGIAVGSSRAHDAGALLEEARVASLRAASSSASAVLVAEPSA
ncbi:hypothetical protein NQ166_09700 [Microbacterium sp. zg.Y1090]|uniref:hypothetical protein n=1 Tax=Microbacterium TaxID=33882 RepID=UPI00214CF7DD|nr:MULTISPECIES: hypothetical protein [unclassified Microbacterium]MCR2811482.1 hypothetical protein [Microbacterium sp. zg.Y1084]MCR2819099.1 hypothetical protein [Microbacterium sp. zg.Y1090]MDL5487902.1 hypothetical protein [Microbacterium sp. zg-Y1211]WIM27402.1 hypothetical protein QNO26_09515 [Microbacterium sp. zg-Y1090]